MKQKNQFALLGGLLLLMVLVWYVNRSRPATVASNASAFQNYQLLAVENPQLHRAKMEETQRTEYRSSGRNPFSDVAPPPAATTTAKAAAARKIYGPEVIPPPPPPTLPANMKFYGYGTVPNGTSRRAFLSDGEDVYIVAEGDTFLGRYRIVKINNGTLEFEETSSGRRNSVALTQDDQGAAPQS